MATTIRIVICIQRIGFAVLCTTIGGSILFAQDNSAPPPAVDLRLYDIVANASSSDRIEADIRKLAGFGTRNTLCTG